MKRWRVQVTRVYELDAADPFAAGERALAAAQRQKDWPEDLRLKVEPLMEYPEAED